MSADSVRNRIFIGAPIDHDSERKFLVTAVQRLEEQRISFVILANFHIGGRQIDCVVATAHSITVVEVKSSYLPVRGTLNGDWSRFHASGDWRAYPNAYQQTINAKYALRDEMLGIRSGERSYPDGHVVFTSGIVEGSELTPGDFKVKVTTLDGFLSGIQTEGTAPWSFDDLQIFARKQNLTPVSCEEAIASSEDLRSAELLRQYNIAFVAEYERDAARWLPENPEQQTALLTAATIGTGCFVTGPSGCGKTLIAKWLATRLADAGNPTFFFSAKDFAGSWADSLKREISLISGPGFIALRRYIVRGDKPVYLVLDGINELGAQRSRALRGVRALARILSAKLIVTGQETKPSEFGGLRSFAINVPSMNLKRRIAQSVCVALTATTLDFLEALSSGMEAEIAGRIGSDLKADLTRLSLLDQYVRTRLGRHARAAAFGLRRLASRLQERVAFSMSEADFDEFMRELEVRFADCDAMFAANLLVRRGGRISFSHEMIQNACAAFDFARKASADPATFGFLLASPLYEAIAQDAVSAIEDAQTCRAILEAVSSPFLLSAAADGKLGAVATSVARSLLTETIAACREEIRSVRLELIKEGETLRVEWAPDGQRSWTNVEEARLRTIGSRAKSGTEPDAYLGLCGEMDERLASERRRLAEGAREARFPLRSESFGLAYYGFGGDIGFTQVSSALHNGYREVSPNAEKREISFADQSSGQLHFVIENRHIFFSDLDEGHFAEELIHLVRDRFRWEPYHVQLAILNAAGFVRQAPAQTLARLVETIESLDVNPANWGIGSAIIDALKFLGALDDEGDATREQIKRELDAVLVEDEYSVDRDLALSLCVRMFDHPFDSIYGEEIYNLDERLRSRLYRRALGASNIKRSMSLSWITREVASFADPSDARLLQPLATLPDPSNPFAQEAWGGFIIATRFLGRHGAELPPVDVDTPAARCLADIRTLLYISESGNRLDIGEATLAWGRLHAMRTPLVVGCLGEVHAALTERHWGETEQPYGAVNLADVYPKDCLKVARRFVEDGVEAQYFGAALREMGPTFAFGTIERYGDRSDMDLLRRRSRGHPFARHAVAALKSLDSVALKATTPSSTL